MSGYYPLFLKVAGKKCVVVGGGEVAERKVEGLLEEGAVVGIISPRLTPGLQGLAERGEIRVIAREYVPGDLEGAVLAIAATDSSEVNRKVAVEGKRRRVLVNIVDDPEHSSFIVPSVVRRGELVIAISTSGQSPALARKIRSELESSLPQEYALLPALLGEVRQRLKQKGIAVDRDIWQESIHIPELLKLLRQGEYKKARDQLISALQGEEVSSAITSQGGENGSSCPGDES